MMPSLRLGGDRVDVDAADPRRGPREILVDKRLVQPHCLEDLRAAVALQCRDPHLRHHLQHALREGENMMPDGLGRVDVGHLPLADQLFDRLERQIRVDGPGAIAEEQRHVVHLPRFARLDDQPASCSCALAHQVVMDAGGRQQTRDRHMLGVHPAVREHKERVAGLDRLAGLTTQLVHRSLEPRRPAAGVEQHRQRHPAQRRVGAVPQLRQLLVVEDRVVDAHLVTGFRLRFQQVPLRAQGRAHVGDELLPDRVERRVGDLGEQLLEVVVEQPRPVRQHRQRRVGAHRPDRLGPGGGHRAKQQPQVLFRVAECPLTSQDRLAVGRRGVGSVS